MPAAQLLGAPSPPAERQDEGGVWRFEFENEDQGIAGPIFDPVFDELFNTTGKSGHLTWGWRFSYTPNATNPDWLDGMAEALFWPPARWKSRVSYALQQSAYTPNSINADNNFLDRPYAGYLLANLRLNFERPFRDNLQFIDHLNLGLGLVGPASGGEVVHQAAHSLQGRSSRNWNEIDSEPVLVAQYETGFRWVWEAADWINFEVYPHGGFSLGNAYTYLSGGGSLRIGSNLRKDSGAPRMKMIMAGTNFPQPGDYWVWNIFAGLEYRAIAYNIFVDGNTYSDTSRTSSRLYVHDFQLGFELGRGVYRLTLMRVFRSKEFDGQEEGDQFIRLGLSAEF